MLDDGGRSGLAQTFVRARMKVQRNAEHDEDAERNVTGRLQLGDQGRQRHEQGDEDSPSRSTTILRRDIAYGASAAFHVESSGAAQVRQVIM